MILDIEKYLSEVDDLISKDSFEYKIIKQTFDELTKNLPSTSAESSIRLSVLDSLRPQISSIIFYISRKVQKLNHDYRISFDKELTRLTVLGRPSYAVMESEIHNKNPIMFTLKEKIDKYNDFSTLLNSYIRSIDQSRLSTIENWRDTRNID